MGFAGDAPIVLETSGLTKRYGEVVALDHLDLRIRKGEVVGLLGPNGAGKTTTVNLLLGVLSPSEGRILLFGQPAGQERGALARRMNFASAYAGLPRNLTLRENLAIFADLYEVPRPRERIASVLAELELSELASQTVMQLSAGQRMRAVLAKALLSEPELLLLDEPTASLDPATADRVRGYLSGLARRGVTLLWTSHNMFEVERYCTRVVFLHRGRVVLDGPPRELARQSGRVVLRLRPRPGPVAALESVLNGRARTAEGGWLELSAESDSQAAEIVARVQQAVGLDGLELRSPTLEDLFLSLARGGKS